MLRSLALCIVSSSLALGAILAAACGGSPTPTGFGLTGSSEDAAAGTGAGGEDAAGTVTPSGGEGGLITGVSDDGGTGSTSNGCSAASQLVYVLSSSNEIYSFEPQTKVFTKISTLQCQAGSMTPNSMAVDRLGNAWVNYVSANAFTGTPTAGAIFKVDIATGACAATNIALTSGWYQLGMGYSTASATDQTDTLYVASTGQGGLGCIGLPGAGAGTSPGLGIVDTNAGTLTPVGPFTGNLAGQSAELTGTGDGRLFGFFVLTPVQVAQITKTTGATPSPITMTGVTCPQAWAFSFWGGDFYLYTSPDGVTKSTVTHYTSADGGIDTGYVTNAGIVIVGAGVSTCAPTMPPAPK
jgi:hypothetical protein